MADLTAPSAQPLATASLPLALVLTSPDVASATARAVHAALQPQPQPGALLPPPSAAPSPSPIAGAGAGAGAGGQGAGAVAGGGTGVAAPYSPSPALNNTQQLALAGPAGAALGAVRVTARLARPLRLPPPLLAAATQEEALQGQQGRGTQPGGAGASGTQPQWAVAMVECQVAAGRLTGRLHAAVHAVGARVVEPDAVGAQAQGACHGGRAVVQQQWWEGRRGACGWPA